MKEFNKQKVEKQLSKILQEPSGLYAVLKPDGTANVTKNGITLPAAWFMTFVEQELYVFAGGKRITTAQDWSKTIAFSFSKTHLVIPATLGRIAAYELITEQALASSDFQFAAAFVVSGMSVFVMANGAFSGDLVWYIQKDWDRFNTAMDLFRQSIPAFSPEKAQKLERFLKGLEKGKEGISDEKAK